VVAVDISVVVVVEIVYIVARIEIVSILRQLDRLAPGLVLHINGLQFHSLVAVAHNADFGAAVPAQIAAQLAHVEREQILARVVVHTDILIVGRIDITVVVDHDIGYAAVSHGTGCSRGLLLLVGGIVD